MSVTVGAVEKDSYAEKIGINVGDILLTLNGEEIMDVLDYRFYQNSKVVSVSFLNKDGERINAEIKKKEYEEIGMLFESYLMDKQRACKNKCIFCFIDQLPKGLRKSLYFKDDDSRLSFLFGNYITLTNITEHEIERIIKMHISPINISVHTTNPELRVKMMKNKTAGEALEIMSRFNDAKINMNCQLVLVPDYNDGKELERTLNDLSEMEYVQCVAAVPVGLTKHRDNLEQIKGFEKKRAAKVIEQIENFAQKCMKKYGERRIYASDEFYLLSERPMPAADYYGEFLQLENGVGLCALLESEVDEDLEEIESFDYERTVSIATGKAAYPLILKIAEKCEQKNKKLKVLVYPIENNFFGEKITVAGLVTATDIMAQLKDKNLGDELLIPSVMLRNEGDMFLDSITVDELSKSLNIAVTPVDNDGYALVENILGIEE